MKIVRRHEYFTIIRPQNWCRSSYSTFAATIILQLCPTFWSRPWIVDIYCWAHGISELLSNFINSIVSQACSNINNDIDREQIARAVWGFRSAPPFDKTILVSSEAFFKILSFQHAYNCSIQVLSVSSQNNPKRLVKGWLGNSSHT
jgi:hypothetical protein